MSCVEMTQTSPRPETAISIAGDTTPLVSQRRTSRCEEISRVARHCCNCFADNWRTWVSIGAFAAIVVPIVLLAAGDLSKNGKNSCGIILVVDFIVFPSLCVGIWHRQT